MAIYYEKMTAWFECTCDDCGEEFCINADSFREGLNELYREGWKAVPEETRSGTEWQHFCPNCK